MLTNNVDGKLKVRLGLSQLMKFTYHPPIKSNIDWLGVSITLKTSAFMHENMN